jgi:hypothetical protein
LVADRVDAADEVVRGLFERGCRRRRGVGVDGCFERTDTRASHRRCFSWVCERRGRRRGQLGDEVAVKIQRGVNHGCWWGGVVTSSSKAERAWVGRGLAESALSNSALQRTHSRVTPLAGKAQASRHAARR